VRTTITPNILPILVPSTTIVNAKVVRPLGLRLQMLLQLFGGQNAKRMWGVVKWEIKLPGQFNVVDVARETIEAFGNAIGHCHCNWLRGQK
jgi:hypothetical protein